MNIKAISKKLLSVALATALLLSCLLIPGLVVSAAKTYDVWDGETLTAPIDRDGDWLYDITNGAELAYVIKNGGVVNNGSGHNFVLANDIYLNHPDAINWLTGEVNTGYEDQVNVWFHSENGDYAAMNSTNIRGNGYTIHGLYMKGGDATGGEDGSGLIPAVASGATVRVENLGIDNSYVNIASQAGLFVGANFGAVTFNNCYTGSAVRVSGQNTGIFVGYTTGSNHLTNCYAFDAGGNALLSASAAPYQAASATTCYAINGSIMGKASRTVTNCYETIPGASPATPITDGNAQGLDALTNAEKMPNLGSGYTATSTYPVANIFYVEPQDPTPTPDYDYWDGETLTAPVDRDSDWMFDITNAAELAYVIKNGGFIGGNDGHNFVLANDIYLNNLNGINWATGEEAWDYTANSWFTSNDMTQAMGSVNIHGNGHTIYGLYNYGGTGYCALVPSVASGETVNIYNLGIDNVYINVTSHASAFVGAAIGGTVNIDGSYAGANVVVSGSAPAIFSSYNDTKITLSNSYSLDAKGGYLISDQSGPYGTTTVKNCYVVNGAIIGKNRAPVNCYETATGAAPATLRTTDNMQGLDALTNAEKMSGLGSAFVATETYPVGTAFYVEPPVTTPEVDYDYWDGETLTEPTDRNSDWMYDIVDAAELAYVIKNGGVVGNGSGHNFVLQNDIYLNNLEGINWETGEVNSDYDVNEWFTSTTADNMNGIIIWGNGHTIYGLYNKDASGTSGLIPKTVADSSLTVTIHDLGIDNVYLSCSGNTGAFLGESQTKVVIDGSYAGANVTVSGGTAAIFAAYNDAAITLTNSYSLDANGGYLLSSQSGPYGATTIQNCYVVNGAIINKTRASSNSYETMPSGTPANQRTAENMQGLDALTNAEKMSGLGAKFVATETYPVGSAFAPIVLPDVDYDVWTGETSAPADSNADGVIEINTAEELAYVIKSGGAGASYIITADLYLNNLEAIDWASGTAMTGYTANQWFHSTGDATATNVVDTNFSGTIDGAGHVIYGLYRMGDDASGGYDGSALIPAIGGTTVVKNLGIDNVYINILSQAGVFAGWVPNAVTFENCYSGATVVVSGQSYGIFGGYGDYNNGNITLTSCYALNANGAGLLSASVGNAKQVASNCYAVNGYILGKGSRTVSNSYETKAGGTAATLLTDVQMQGLNVLEGTMSNLGFAYMATETYPVLKAFHLDSIGGGELTVWDGTKVAPSDSDSDGVLEINTAEELAYVIYNGGAGGSYKLTTDIYLNNPDLFDWATGSAISVKSWFHSEDVNYTALADGTVIDGAGHTVYGLYRKGGDASGGEDGSALIPAVAANANVTIKNLAIDKAYINISSQAGLFVGVAPSNNAVTTFENCFTGAEVTVCGQYYGTFMGYGGAGVYMTNCYSLNANGSYLLHEQWGGKNLYNCYVVNGNLTAKASSTKGSNNHVATEANKGSQDFVDTLGFAYELVEGDYPALKIFSMEIGAGAWDGTLTAPSDANSDGIYEITNASELAYVVKNGGGASYIFTNDIYVNDIEMIDWTNGSYVVAQNWFNSETTEGYVPMMDGTVIDGNGYMVYGLYSNDTTGGAGGEDGTAFIPAIAADATVTVQNLGIDYAYMKTNAQTGLFFGVINGAQVNIDNCFAGENITLVCKDYAGVAAAYGVATLNVGNFYNLSTKGYPVFCETWGQHYINGVFTVSGPITNYTGPASNVVRQYSGVYATTNSDDVVTEGAVNVITTDMMKGYDVLTNPAKMSALNVSDAYYAIKSTTASYPEFRIRGTIFGDVDEDGVYLTANDVTMARRTLVGLDGWSNLDYNRDGVANVLDLVALKANASGDAPAATGGWVSFSVANGAKILYTADTKPAAESLQVYYADFDVALDLTAANNGGVAISVSVDENLSGSEYNVAIVDGVLTFTGANEVAVQAAVEAFIAKAPDKGMAFEFADSYDGFTETVTVGGNTYNYVWGDEFGGYGTYTEQGWENGNWTARESEAGVSTAITDIFVDDTDDVIKLEDGKLVLTAYKAGTDSYRTPATVMTKNTMTYRYGYVEMRAKVPYENGVWPAFWMSSNEDGANLEVDIFEVFGDTTTATPNIHRWGSIETDSFDHDQASQNSFLTITNKVFASTEEANQYHTYGFEWTPEAMTMYVDGVAYMTFDITSIASVFGLADSYSNDDTSIFHNPMYLMLTQNVFTNASELGGVVAPNGITVQDTDFESSEYVIDYVRLYQNDTADTGLWIQ